MTVKRNGRRNAHSTKLTTNLHTSKNGEERGQAAQQSVIVRVKRVELHARVKGWRHVLKSVKSNSGNDI